MDFDKRAREWDSNPLNIERTQAVAEAMRRRIPIRADHTALEYGCGTGMLSFLLQSSLRHITLVDTSEGMLQVLREKIAAARLTHLTPRRLDLMTEPLPASSFDLIYTAMTLHHVDDTAKIAGIFHAMLRPGGHLCVVDLDSEDGSFHDQGEFHGHFGFDRGALGTLLGRAGFARIEFETVHTIVKEQAGGTRAYPLFLVTAVKA